MEEQRIDIPEEEQVPEGYQPRPAWQVWGARIALVIFIILILIHYFNMSRGIL